MKDIKGREVTCTICGLTKCPVGRSVPMGRSYCAPKLPLLNQGCDGYDQDPKAGWLFNGELWSESFGEFPMPEPNECYIPINRDGGE